VEEQAGAEAAAAAAAKQAEEERVRREVEEQAAVEAAAAAAAKHAQEARARREAEEQATAAAAAAVKQAAEAARRDDERQRREEAEERARRQAVTHMRGPLMDIPPMLDSPSLSRNDLREHSWASSLLQKSDSLRQRSTGLLSQPPEHSPVVAKPLGMARRDLARLVIERRDVLSSIYRNPLPHIPSPRANAAIVGKWALRQPSLTNTSLGSSTMTVFPQTSSKGRVMLPEWPPRPALDGGAYPARSLTPLKGPSQDVDIRSPGLRRHASRVEQIRDPRDAATEIRANAERQIRQMCERGFLTTRTRLVLEVEVDPGPEALRLGDRKGSKSQKVLKSIARALSRENGVDSGFSVMNFCNLSWKEGRTSAFEVRLIVYPTGGSGAPESVLVYSKIATRK
jgi:flagellar biosynthesis GTPase FlhF